MAEPIAIYSIRGLFVDKELSKVQNLIMMQGGFALEATAHRIKTLYSICGPKYGNKIFPNHNIPAILNALNKQLNFTAIKTIRIKVNKKIGLINTKGEVLVKPTYDVIKNFRNGHAKVKLNEKWGMIDPAGNVVIPIEYNEVGDYSEAGIWAKKGETFGVISNGEFHGNSDINKISDFHFGGDITYARSEKLWGFINNKAEWVVAAKYKKVKAFRGGLVS